MQDRPTYDELLAAVEHFLDTEIVPNIGGARGFHARVAANAVRIVRRELEREEEHLAAEWAGLDALLGAAEMPASRQEAREALRARNEELCELIREGGAEGNEEPATILRAHVRSTVRAKLETANPRLLDTR